MVGSFKSSLARCMQAFVAVLLLASWMAVPDDFAPQQLDILELFAGRARIARLAEVAGYAAMIHDIAYDKTAFSSEPSKSKRKKQTGKSCMDLNTSAGYASLVLPI